MSREYSPKTFIVSGTPTNDLEITDTDAHLSEALAFGAIGFTNGLFVVESELDQTANITIRGRHPDCDDWQTAVGSIAVGAGLNVAIPVTAPWGELGASIVCPVAPTSGSLKVVFLRVRGSAPGPEVGGASNILRAAISAAGNGDNTLVAAVSGQKIKVLGLFMVAAGDVEVRLETGAGGAALTGVISLPADGSSFVLPIAPPGYHWVETVAGALLNLELSGAVQVSGALVYRME